ncbi:protein MraZ [Gaiella occulta]|uniref:Transcriptional regulator MraZ n=1 Tax=Gaiella occulta TaxID=1002870 RepID=A0A7M2YYN4_9ACTN|nr:division/cell wall cluster transcriptional repressor MraZ [Gaiella occulta]RDI74988.1 protein MraZ [Gaiella occulta]
MFFGEYEHAIDDKSRLTLPARFRDAMAGGVVLAKGLDGSVDVYPRATWEMNVVERIGRLDPLLPDTRLLQRHFFGGASEDTPDKQGRVHLPAALVRHGKLAKEVTVVGNYDHLEIWDRAAWAERLERIEGSADNVAQRLAEQHG